MKISPALAKAIELTVKRHNQDRDQIASKATEANVAAYHKKHKPAVDRLATERKKLMARLEQIDAELKDIGYERKSYNHKIELIHETQHQLRVLTTCSWRETDLTAKVISATEVNALKILADHGIIWK